MSDKEKDVKELSEVEAKEVVGGNQGAPTGT